MPFRFRLFVADGDDAEPHEFVSASGEWGPGDELLTADRQRWRVLEIVPNEWEEFQPMYHGFFVVEPLASPEPPS